MRPSLSLVFGERRRIMFTSSAPMVPSFTLTARSGRLWNRERKNICWEFGGTSDNDIFVVGDNATILHYDGETWSPMENPREDYYTKVRGSSL